MSASVTVCSLASILEAYGPEPQASRELVTLRFCHSSAVNTYAWLLLAVAAAAAAVDWYVVGRGPREVEQVAGPAVPTFLAAFAWLLHADLTTSGRWLLVALGFCLFGDVLLLRRSDRLLGIGLVSFLCAQVAFAGSVLTMSHRQPFWVGVVITVLLVLAVVAVALVPLARRDPVEGVPPLAYGLVIGAVGCVAWWSGHLLVAVGASLFIVSDATLASSRFGRDFRGSALVVMVTYHLALGLLTVGLLRPDLVA